MLVPTLLLIIILGPWYALGLVLVLLGMFYTHFIRPDPVEKFLRKMYEGGKIDFNGRHCTIVRFHPPTHKKPVYLDLIDDETGELFEFVPAEVCDRYTGDGLPDYEED